MKRKIKQKIVYVRLDPALHAAVKRLAHQRYCSMNELVTVLLEREVDKRRVL